MWKKEWQKYDGPWIFPPFLFQTVASEMEKTKTTLEPKFCFRFFIMKSNFHFWLFQTKIQNQEALAVKMAARPLEQSSPFEWNHSMQHPVIVITFIYDC